MEGERETELRQAVREALSLMTFTSADDFTSGVQMALRHIRPEAPAGDAAAFVAGLASGFALRHDTIRRLEHEVERRLMQAIATYLEDNHDD